MSIAQFSVLVEQMHRARERLLAAFAEEARLSESAYRFPEDEDIFGQWARSRRAVEECGGEYGDAVACCELSHR